MILPSDIPQHVQLGIQLESIFMPFARTQRDALFEKGKRFVHYTSADAALKIIGSKRLWMRSTTFMVDYREIQHFFDVLHEFFQTSQMRQNSFRLWIRVRRVLLKRR